jgi:hypothetical protein
MDRHREKAELHRCSARSAGPGGVSGMNFIVVALITGLAMSDTLEFVARSHRVAILSGLICVNDIGKSERIISPLYDRPLFAEFVRHHAKIGSVNPGAARRAGPEIQTRVRERLV